ncbi:unnamed protein product [Rhizophagus irregularis]|nr:unnamed protein product [Rhizophagus irregularis]
MTESPKLIFFCAEGMVSSFGMATSKNARGAEAGMKAGGTVSSFRTMIRNRDKWAELALDMFRLLALGLWIYRHWIDIGYPCDRHCICINRHRRRLAESLDPWIEFQSIQIPGWSPGW